MFTSNSSGFTGFAKFCQKQSENPFQDVAVLFIHCLGLLRVDRLTIHKHRLSLVLIWNTSLFMFTSSNFLDNSSLMMTGSHLKVNTITLARQATCCCLLNDFPPRGVPASCFLQVGRWKNSKRDRNFYLPGLD